MTERVRRVALPDPRVVLLRPVLRVLQHAQPFADGAHPEQAQVAVGAEVVRPPWQLALDCREILRRPLPVLAPLSDKGPCTLAEPWRRLNDGALVNRPRREPEVPRRAQSLQLDHARPKERSRHLLVGRAARRARHPERRNSADPNSGRRKAGPGDGAVS